MVAIAIGNGSNANDDDLELTEAELAEPSNRNLSTTISMESARRASFRD
ncbi:hypothetical protein PC129_g8851 [Phytophthora cactorum]|uniref:Uncharacterized protein n=1 Tax=Phytophthora cactorum TaxID=29920 RepID=A0A8T1KQB8_9STRA|nr:hypothetical protein PC129_g8851 [Phytophthora cactorum]KAG4236691.1 hypothetical protein PC116_g15226 [Phytophthora cactorum]